MVHYSRKDISTSLPSQPYLLTELRTLLAPQNKNRSAAVNEITQGNVVGVQRVTGAVNSAS